MDLIHRLPWKWSWAKYDTLIFLVAFVVTSFAVDSKPHMALLTLACLMIVSFSGWRGGREVAEKKSHELIENLCEERREFSSRAAEVGGENEELYEALKTTIDDHAAAWVYSEVEGEDPVCARCEEIIINGEGHLEDCPVGRAISTFEKYHTPPHNPLGV